MLRPFRYADVQCFDPNVRIFEELVIEALLVARVMNALSHQHERWDSEDR